jgi:hypothetical protein
MGYGRHAVARWFFSPTFGSRSPLKTLVLRGLAVRQITDSSLWTALVRLARRHTAAGRESI